MNEMEIQQKPWKGYTLDELRMHRLLTLTKIEIDKSKLNHLTQNYTNAHQLTKSSPIFRKLFGALDYIDYGIIAFKLGKQVLRIFGHRKSK